MLFDTSNNINEDPLMAHVYTLNTSFIQIYEMFDQIIEKLDGDGVTESYQLPNIIPLVNEIQRFRSSISRSDWQAARAIRNHMVHHYPHRRRLWAFAWSPLKRVIEPLGLEARNLLQMINQTQSIVKSNIEAKSIQLETAQWTIAELGPVTWATVARRGHGRAAGRGRGQGAH